MHLKIRDIIPASPTSREVEFASTNSNPVVNAALFNAFAGPIKCYYGTTQDSYFDGCTLIKIDHAGIFVATYSLLPDRINRNPPIDVLNYKNFPKKHGQPIFDLANWPDAPDISHVQHDHDLTYYLDERSLIFRLDNMPSAPTVMVTVDEKLSLVIDDDNVVHAVVYSQLTDEEIKIIISNQLDLKSFKFIASAFESFACMGVTLYLVWKTCLQPLPHLLLWAKNGFWP
jgi:hypothetical protein